MSRLVAIGLACAVGAFGVAFGAARALGGHAAPRAPRVRTVAAATKPPADPALAAGFAGKPASLKLPPPRRHRRVVRHAPATVAAVTTSKPAPSPAPSTATSTPSTTPTSTTPVTQVAPVQPEPAPAPVRTASTTHKKSRSGSGSGTTIIP